MKTPSLRCRCGGEYKRQHSQIEVSDGSRVNTVSFICFDCLRHLSGPLELEDDLRYELQQMNLQLPDGMVDDTGTPWFATARCDDAKYYRSFVSKQHNCLLSSPYSEEYTTAKEAIESVIDCQYSSPINRRQVVPEEEPTPEVEPVDGVENTFTSSEVRAW